MKEIAKINEKVYSILTSLITNPNWCPTKNLIYLSDEIVTVLIQTAQNNKLAVLLYHFARCKSCKPYISEEHKKEILKLYQGSLATTMAVDSSEKKVVSLLRRKKINFCLVKNWGLYPKLYRRFLRTSTDIDVLISERDKTKVIKLLSKQEFRKYDHFQMSSKDTKRIFYEEHVLRNNKNKVKVDLRYLVAMPNQKDYPLFLQKDVDYLSKMVLTYQNTKENPLPIELFLLTQIMHFFSNDLMRGLRHLYEIIYLAKIYQKRINWRRFYKLAGKYNVRLVAVFIFSFAKDFFGFKLKYTSLSSADSFSIKLARLALRSQKIVFFPRLEVWSDEVVSIGRENMILRLLLQQRSLTNKLYQFKFSDARSVFLQKMTSFL